MPTDIPLPEQASKVSAVWSSKVKADELWAVIDSQWFGQWCKASGFSPKDNTCQSAEGADVPGPIDNSKLSEPGHDYALRKGIWEEEDYALVIKDVWDLLKEWYGGGPEYIRKTEVIGFRKEARVDLYPVYITTIALNDKGEPDNDKKEVIKLEKKDSLKGLVEMFEKKLAGPVRLWMEDKPSSDDEGAGLEEEPAKKKWVLVRDEILESSLDTLGIRCTDEIWVDHKVGEEWARSTIKKNYRDFEVGDEVDCKDSVSKWYLSDVLKVDKENKKVFIHYKNWNSKWDEWIDFDSDRLCAAHTHTSAPYKPKSRLYNGASSYGYSRYNASQAGTPAVRGAVGLRNLGNTCFMNSTIQCLSNTPILTEMFMEDKHVPDINRDNPLGCDGRIADEYASLIKEMWGGNFTIVSPVGLKAVIGKFAPRFSGYAQHDSSELLSFLVDGLHEDLNRVRKKPATSTVESDGREDKVVAQEAWETHLLRNQSMIVDHVMGQLKSKLVCPDCNRVSITFDPFMILSVPLPQKEDHEQVVTFVYADTSKKLLKLQAQLPRVSHIVELKQAISRLVDIPARRMAVTDIWRNKVSRVYRDDESLSMIRSNDKVFVYEIPELEEMDAHNALVINIHNVFDGNHSAPFGLPHIVVVDRTKEVNMKQVHEQIQKRMNVWATGKHEVPFKAICVLRDRPRYCGICSDISCNGCEVQDLDKPIRVSMMNRPEILLLWKDSLEDYNENRLTPDIHHESHALGNESEEEATGSKVMSLYDCFSAFTQEETLGEHDPWYCNKCKKHQQATKKFDLYKLPDILIVHMKRFSYSRLSRDKITTPVDFPVTDLDIAPFCMSEEDKQNAVYDLYAVSNHYGALGGGHYTAYCKNLLDGNWYLHDDSRVKPISADDVVTPNAYVLFYKKKTLDMETE